MEGDSSFFSATSVVIINCSKMTIFPPTVCGLSLSSWGEIPDMERRVMAVLHPALAFIMPENQLVEARNRFPFERRENFLIARMCFHRKQ